MREERPVNMEEGRNDNLLKLRNKKMMKCEMDKMKLEEVEFSEGSKIRENGMEREGREVREERPVKMEEGREDNLSELR